MQHASGCNLSEPESLDLQVTLHGPFVLPDISWEIGIELLVDYLGEYLSLGSIRGVKLQKRHISLKNEIL